MLKELATVAAYGASASFGRDVYKSAKQGNPLLWLLLAAVASVYGFKILASTRGQSGGARLLSVVGSVFLILLGSVIFTGMIFIFLALSHVADNYFAGNVPKIVSFFSLITFAFIILSAFIGTPWGSSERREAERASSIEEYNLQFFEDNGFQDSGLGDDLIEDAEGNRLKLKEEQVGRMVFSVVGRRNVRAVITLDDEGRMIEYTGAVRL